MVEFKREVEKRLGCGIEEQEFLRALECAKRKQDWIYVLEHRPETLERRYLVILTVEYVKQLAFSEFTMNLCRSLRHMEKEHPSNQEPGAHACSLL